MPTKQLSSASTSILRYALCVFFLLKSTGFSQTTDLPTVAITSAEESITEFFEPYTIFNVTRRGDLSQPLEVKYLVSGTAKNGVDYQRLSGSLTIPAGEYTWPLEINALDDDETEDPETLEIDLIPTTAPFQIVALPDTQFYTTKYATSLGGKPEMFSSQTQWIIDNKAQSNIAFVLHEGDCTQDNLELEWQRARASMGLLDGVVPYAVAVGNHDGIWNPTNETMWFNKYFAVTNYEGLPSFGGVYELGKMDNSYHYFSAGGIDWLVLSLEWGPRNAVLDWANTVVASHPDRKVIYLSHTHVYIDNTLHGSKPYHQVKPTDYRRDNNGTHVWDKLVRRYANSALFFNGHVFENGTGQGRLVGVGDHGNRVYQMLCNYQGNVNGGCGFLRYLTFYPDEDRFEAKSYSPYLDRSIIDDGNEFAYDHLGIFTNVVPTYLIDSNRSHVSLTILSDEIDTTPPTIKSVSASGNPAEIEILFSEPLDEESAEIVTNYLINSPVPITNAILSTDLKTVLLTCKTSLVPMATYTLTVSGVKDRTFQSNEMTAPLSQSFLYFPVLFSENFSDTNLENWTIVDEGSIDFPSIWNVVGGRMFQYANIYAPVAALTTNTSRKGTFSYLNKPLSFRWRNYAASVTLNNADNDGIGLMFRYQNRSNYYKLDFDAEHSFRRLTKKVNGVETEIAYETGSFPANRDVKLRITAYENELTATLDGTAIFGGTITDNSLTRGTIALYSFGSVGAKFDDIVVTTQNPPPNVAVVSPADGAKFNFGSSIPIQVAASDATGIAKVELYYGNVWLKTLTNPPFNFTWTNPPPGNYELTARATDIFDTVGVSDSISFAVGAALPEFLLQPQDQIINMGHGVVFRTRVTGTPPLRYQWMFNGNPISGATNPIFFMNNVHEENAGVYTMQVSGPSATVTSQPALLSPVADDSPPPPDAPPVLTVEERDLRLSSLFSVYGSAGIVQVLVSTDLQTWTPLITLTNGSGRVFFTDPNRDSRPRFYRAISTH